MIGVYIYNAYQASIISYIIHLYYLQLYISDNHHNHIPSRQYNSNNCCCSIRYCYNNYYYIISVEEEGECREGAQQEYATACQEHSIRETAESDAWYVIHSFDGCLECD